MDPNESKAHPRLGFSSGGEFEEISELAPFYTMPFSAFDSFESHFGHGGRGEESLSGVPRCLESLHETPVPAFLSKTFDLVDDPSLDAIISWGVNGNSFVVWDPVEFSRIILPRNFKHNNFSSFVRQLNTYGFRKIDCDKWEFANEGFIRGHRHMLKTIQRRKSILGSSSGSSKEAHKSAKEDEIECLKRERKLMMQEVVELQHQQRGNIQQMEIVEEKLVAAEKRQKQMTSFLAKMFQNPTFLARLQQKREEKSIASPRTMKKFVKHQDKELGTSNLPLKGQLVKYEPPLLDTGKEEFLTDHEFLDTIEPAGEVSALGTTNPVVKGNSIENRQTRNRSKYFVSFPEDLGLDKRFHEFSAPRTESMVAEDVWRMGFEANASMSSSSTELWGNLSSYGVPEFGVSHRISDIWDVSSLQREGSFGNEKWPDEDSCPYEPDN